MGFYIFGPRASGGPRNRDLVWVFGAPGAPTLTPDPDPEHSRVRALSGSGVGFLVASQVQITFVLGRWPKCQCPGGSGLVVLGLRLGRQNHPQECLLAGLTFIDLRIIFDFPVYTPNQSPMQTQEDSSNLMEFP